MVLANRNFLIREDLIVFSFECVSFFKCVLTVSYVRGVLLPVWMHFQVVDTECRKCNPGHDRRSRSYTVLADRYYLLSRVWILLPLRNEISAQVSYTDIVHHDRLYIYIPRPGYRDS